MREAFGGISLFQIVIILLILFAGIIAFSINHSKAFAVKDELLHILESGKHKVNDIENNPLTDETAQAIAEYLSKSGYSTRGTCEEGWVGYDSRGKKGGNTIFCVRGKNVGDNSAKYIVEECDLGATNCHIKTGLSEKEYKKIVKENGGTFPTMVYYDIALFYQLDIPIINNFLNFRLKGTTKLVYGDE